MALALLGLGRCRKFLPSLPRNRCLQFRALTFYQSGTVSIVALIFMRETYAPVLLKRKAARLSVERGNPLLVAKGDLGLTPTALFVRSIVRPVKMLMFSPIVLALSTFCALVFGLTFLLFTTFPSVFQDQYGFTNGISGLSYLGLGIGMIFGTF